MLLPLQLNLAGAGPDTTPDAFSFNDQSGVSVSSLCTSNSITVAAIDSPAAISVTDGEYSINGGAFTSSPGTVVDGDTVRVRHTASASYSTATDTVLTIGGVSDTFTSTTESEPSSSGGTYQVIAWRRRRRRLH